MIQQRQRETTKLLRRNGLESLKDKRILEIGCGRGDVLHELLGYRNVQARDLSGIDLHYEALCEARERFCGTTLAFADAQTLPFADDQFDLVLQYTVFSSILDDTLKQTIAREILRVLKPTGAVLWYDFWLNPTNPQTRGIRRKEIETLFPTREFVFRKITLAPPITRTLISTSWILCAFLENLKFLNTHYLVLIRPK